MSPSSPWAVGGDVRVQATAATVSWLPSESITGLLTASFATGLSHFDAPPPDALSGLDEVHALAADDRLRFANLLSGWAEFDGDAVTGSGLDDVSGLVMGSTTVRVGPLGATFRAARLPVLRPQVEHAAGAVTFTQTVGGRTALPLPRPVPHRPFVQWSSPLVWTTLQLTLKADGTSQVVLSGASAFPRHWVYGADGRLAFKSGVTDQDTWVQHSFGARTPWGAQDSTAVVVAAESDLERQMSADIMRGGARPRVERLAPGDVLTRQGDPGRELYLLLDGVLRVDVDGRELAEVGPGAVLGERALLEGGIRTSTLTAVTPARVAVAPHGSVDVERLRSLQATHRREDEPEPSA